MGIWSCTSAAPIIRWMVGKTPAAAKIELRRLGCSFEWIDRSNLTACNTARPSEGKSSKTATQGTAALQADAPASLKGLRTLGNAPCSEPTGIRVSPPINREPAPYPVTTQAR